MPILRIVPVVGIVPVVTIIRVVGVVGLVLVGRGEGGVRGVFQVNGRSAGGLLHGLHVLSFLSLD